ncbi:hypothetical protein BDV30DRAFT_221830 [Aspergillus minisclerotigenes]|uniref:Uncharacterized protein n=1 Tax=Aspergillus minisclerotigenes TaxID=656917 RepID=A0A5N6IMX6_9EURO|nr:hypothetical protein BDV30DRAFT_221830 [Aspergillus minisclerotigenes]
MKKSYFLMRNQDYEYKPGESVGWLNLGSILTKPNDPESLLEGYSIVPPHHDMPIKFAWKQDFKSNCEVRTSRGYGIFAKFLETLLVPLRLNSTYTRDSMRANEVSLPRLETYFMTPTKPYLDEVLGTPAVQKFLREKNFFNSPYIVTGIRVARHGSGSNMTSESVEIDFGVDIDAGAASGVPGMLSVGPSLSHAAGATEKNEYATSSNYIYAYRLAKIHYSIRQSRPKLAYMKGELYDFDGDSEQPCLPAEASITTCEARMDLIEGWVPTKCLPLELKDEDEEPCQIILAKA